VADSTDYVCSICGAAAYYDGRCGDGPVLTCGCDRSYGWVDDGRGGYYDGPGRAVPSDQRQGGWDSWEGYASR
jgi:hypothetical protein